MYAGKQPEGVSALLFVDENGVEIQEESVKLVWPPIGGQCIELAGKTSTP